MKSRSGNRCRQDRKSGWKTSGPASASAGGFSIRQRIGRPAEHAFPAVEQAQRGF